MIKWDSYKDQKFRETRGINFEDTVEAIAAGKILDILKHHKQEIPWTVSYCGRDK